MADLSITAANVLLITGRPLQGTALETITAGQPLYHDGTIGIFGNNLGLADANTVAKKTPVGVALHAALAGQPILYSGTNDDVVAYGTILTVNGCYIVSATGSGGAIAPIADLAAGWYLGVLGFAKTTSQLTLRLFSSGVSS